jgi:translation elongation factor EF-G
LLRRTLNLGILAYVDAGKPTLTERLVYACGVRKVGSCGVAVFVDESSESVAPFHAG